jgi:thymidylate synthase (FAD)
MKVTVIDSMGSDLSVVNAARVSFGKTHKKLTDGDKKLIKYLAKHGHWTPFGHASITYHVEAPIFVARQLVKHQVGLVWNEISRRYVESIPEYWTPDEWRSKPVDKKQGSGDDTILWLNRNMRVGSAVNKVCDLAVETYKQMIDSGIAPEQARMILPQNVYTEWYWSGSLYAFARVCNLRCQEDAQKETQDICWQIDEMARFIFPTAWSALRDVEG